MVARVEEVGVREDADRGVGQEGRGGADEVDGCFGRRRGVIMSWVGFGLLDWERGLVVRGWMEVGEVLEEGDAVLGIERETRRRS